MNTGNNTALLNILRKSHEQALAGETYSMDYVEHFMHEKLMSYALKSLVWSIVK